MSPSAKKNAEYLNKWLIISNLVHYYNTKRSRQSEYPLQVQNRLILLKMLFYVWRRREHFYFNIFKNTETMKKFIFWKLEGLVSEIEKEENGFVYYKYAVGNIKDSHNSFMGDGKIRKDALITNINNDEVILF